MGSNHSQNPKKKVDKVDTSMFGHVYLHTDKAEMYGGETITGNIHLNILQDFPGNKIHIQLKGKETYHRVREHRYTRTVSRLNDRTERYENVEEDTYVNELHSTNKIILDKNVIVYEFPQGISPGQYTIPFAFCLPSNLPGSFYQEGYRHLARIHYTLKAYIPSNLEKNVSMSYKLPIIVREFFNQETTESSDKLEKISKELSCCRCDSGVATLTASLEKDAYNAGDIAYVLINLDLSKSKEHFGPISISLVHHLDVKVEFVNEPVLRTLKTVNVAGMRAGSSSKMKKIAFQLPQVSQEDNYHQAKAYGILKYLLKISNKNNFVNMTINRGSRRECMHSWYDFKISCQTKQCCSTKMEVSCPVNIYCPEIGIKYPPIAVLDWNPIKLEHVNIAFDPQLPQTETTKTFPIKNAMVSNDMVEGSLGIANMF